MRLNADFMNYLPCIVGQKPIILSRHSPMASVRRSEWFGTNANTSQQSTNQLCVIDEYCVSFDGDNHFRNHYYYLMMLVLTHCVGARRLVDQNWLLGFPRNREGMPTRNHDLYSALFGQMPIAALRLDVLEPSPCS